MGAVLCSVTCLLIQRTAVKVLLWESTDLHTDMPAKRGRPKKTQDDVDENLSEDDDVLLRKRASSRRQRKVVSYIEEVPQVTKKTKKTKKNILTDANDNEITDTHSKIPKKVKASKRSDKTELTENKMLKIKTEENEMKIKKKGILRKKKKKENKISFETKRSDEDSDGICNVKDGSTVANGPDKGDTDVQVTSPGISEGVSVTCGQGNDSTSQPLDVTVNLEATFIVGSPSSQDDARRSLEDKNPANVTWEDSRDTSVTQEIRKNTNNALEDTQNTDVTDNTNVTMEDTHSTNVTLEDTHGTNVTLEDTQNTNVTLEDTHSITSVALEDTQNTNVTFEDTHSTSVALEDTHNTNVTREGSQNKRVTQKDKRTTNISRNNTQTLTSVTRLENADTIAEKVVLKLKSQQNDHLRPLLERMDDLMKVMADLSLENKELRRMNGHVQVRYRPDTDSSGRSRVEDEIIGNAETMPPSTEWSDSAVQTSPTPLVHVQVQTTEKYENDTGLDELISVQNERDILWEKCQSQTKVIRDLQNDLYTTRGDFSKDKVTYQAALVTVLTTPSDPTRLYSSIVARLSRDNLSLDELCTLVSEAKPPRRCSDDSTTKPPRRDSDDSITNSPRRGSDGLTATESWRDSDDVTATGSRRVNDDTSRSPVRLAEVKLEPRSPPGNPQELHCLERQ